MSFNESLEMEVFDEERSRERVIDFVQAHPGCIVRDIVNAQSELGRKKVFRILRDLKKEKIIVEEKLKSKRRVRNKKLFVNKANPYTVVLSDLKRFEKIYFSILNKTVNAFNNKTNLDDRTPSEDDLVKIGSAVYLMLQPHHIFYGFLNIYMVRLITNWSKEIRYKDVLNKVNNMIFAKFASIQISTNKTMASVSSESIGLSYLQMQMNTMDQLKERLENLKKYDMEKEFKALLKFTDGIIVSDQIRAYFRNKKHRLYRWDLKYKKEDIEALAQDMARHPDWLDNAYSS
jgi:hypothetical protein